MFKNKFLNWLRVNFWRIISAIFASITFAFVIFPFLMNLKFVNTFFNALLVNSRNMKLIIGLSSILQLVFIAFGERVWRFIEKYFNSIKKGFVSLGPIISIIIFIILSTGLIKLFETQYNTVLLVIGKCLLLFLLNLCVALIIWSIRNLIGRLSSQFSSNQSPIQINEQSENILTDDPIVSPSEDSLDRKKFVEDIYEEIVNFPSDSSFVFGLYGGWGEGKTSVLNLLKQKFENNGNFLVFDFDPWYFKDKESTLKAFYNGLEHTFSEKYVLPGFSKAVKKYLHYISFGTNVGISLSLSNANESAEEMKQRIESYLEKTNTKLLVVIDDIDRLQADEVLQIFGLVKCNADLKNAIFVLSFDPLVIEKLLQKDLNSDRQYLEKIVQMSINLPAIPSENISNFLINNINELLKRMSIPDDKKENFYKEFLPTYRAYIPKFFRTLRHVKRYMNGLSATLPAIKSEVNLNDFFILEAIRVFYPSIYNDIWSSRRFYIRVGWEEDPSQLFRKKEEISSAVKEHVESMLKEAVGEDKEQSEILLELLKILFPVKVKNAFEQGNEDYTYYMHTFRAEQRLTHPECFVKYFMLKVPPSELSDEFMEDVLWLWSNWGNLNEVSWERINKILSNLGLKSRVFQVLEKGNVVEPYKKIEYKKIEILMENLKDIELIEKVLFILQERKALKEFFSKLRIFMDKIDEDLAVHIIMAIYSNADKFSKEGTEDFWNSEYDKALAALLWLINDKIDKQKIKGMLEEIINLTPSIPFAVEVVLLCKKEGNGSLYYNIYESIDFEELVDVISGRLKKHFIDEKRDIFIELPEERDWAFVLYQWASDWTTFKDKNKNIVNNYLVSLIKDNPKKLAKFLMSLRRRNPNNEMVFVLNEFAKVYNLGEFANLAEKFKNNSELPDEEKKVLEQFLELYRSKPPAS